MASRKKGIRGTAASRRAVQSPVVPQTALTQNVSRGLLDDALKPWLVTRWEQHDYGVDAAVEIITPIPGTTDHAPSGKLFMVQLRATDSADVPRSLEIGLGHLRYWLGYSLPVLLVSTHRRSKLLRGRWDDQRLIAELKARNADFWAQKTVSVDFEGRDAIVLGPDTQPPVEQHVIRFHARASALTPTKFFDLRNRVDRTAQALLETGVATGLASVRLLVEKTQQSLRTSAYMVAITGPQRVGKSTLINALLGFDISPVADFPTTAVPLIFGSGEKARASVTFEDGKTEDIEASADALRPYAAQQESNSNSRHVQFIRVTLPNDTLARGIEIVDTPGLHDASEAVRVVTETALTQADAAVFVLDAGLGAKFKLSVHDVEDLRRLRARKERLIILLNQSDLLDPGRRDALLSYVLGELKKYGLGDGLPCQPMFVSGADAWNARSAGVPVPAEFLRVEDELWGHLLRHGRTGLHRLQVAITVLQGAAEEIATLALSREQHGREAADIDAARKTCADAVARVKRLARDCLNEGTAEIIAALAEEVRDLQQEWRQGLENTPPETALPTREKATEHLKVDLEILRDAGWRTKEIHLMRLAERISKAVQDALADARMNIGVPPIVSMPDPHLPDLPAIDESLPETFWGGLIGAAFFVFNPVLGIATTLFGLAIGHDKAVERRRARTLKKLIEEYNSRLALAHGYLLRHIRERFEAGVGALVAQARSRLDTFIHDAEQRIERLGRPTTPAEEKLLLEARQAVEASRKALLECSHDLSALMYGSSDGHGAA